MYTSTPAEVLPRDRGDAAAPKLARLIACRTVSSRIPEEVDDGEFARFRAELAALFPVVHRRLTLEEVGGGLLFRWQGTEDELDPVVLMAHYDVVPVQDESTWEHPPFAGVLADGWIHGRGALDDKGSLAAILEAVETLLEEGFTPSRTVWLSFGDNEETAGDTAARAAAILQERGVRPWLVLDEGGAVASQAFPFVTSPVAVIGVSEKGILDVELSVEDPGGHASTPTRLGAAARLARAVVRLDQRPFPAALHPVTIEMLGRLAAGASPLPAALFARAGSLRLPLTRIFGALGGEPNALTRTTVALTQLSGSKASNVLPTRATANANVRIAPGESIDSVLRRMRRTVRDRKVSLRVVEGSEPSPVSSTSNAQFAALETAIREVFPDAIPAPYIMLGGTDSRRYTAISDAVYRFAPFRMDKAARASIHADNEKLSLHTFGEGITFYRRLLQNLVP
ncbi:M20 family peptidase [Arthrobacter gandavensis]|uniref:M20 family peptidase n=1 Tax=Arthrobacter gandavensis TaxID=169960 RepID=A0ABP5AII7_9MICC|nr:M20/M25/M40 family metallo-hydrolase [Arthrobacter citreus]